MEVDAPTTGDFDLTGANMAFANRRSKQVADFPQK